MKPLMVKCDRCRNVFSEDEMVEDRFNGGYRGEPHYSCPFCRDDSFTYVTECVHCGSYVDSDEIFGSTGSTLCIDCIHELTDVPNVIEYGNDTQKEVEINGLFAYAFDGRIDEILKKEFDALPETEQRKLVRDYVDCDKGDFADWMEGGRA